ncbi:MAG: type VI secretion system tip protein VgrG, partial [Pseudomonadota bacterium]
MTEGREFSVTTPLGSDVLLFDYMSGQDEIGRCFQFELGLLSEDLNITADQILGKPVTVSAQPGGLGETRYFNGLVSEFRLDEITEGYAHYVAIVKPWLWFLSLSEDCKIFQNLSIPDIIEEVFSEYGTATYEVRLQGSYDPVEFCVQFNESDLNFVERLMQKVGIFYYFEHADGEHTLVLTNDVAALESVPGFAEIPFRSDESSRFEDFEAFSSWSPIGSVTTGEFTHTDYDFTKPAADLMTKSSDPQGHDGADAEIYRYPGIYHQISAGDALAVVHRQEVQAIASRIRAKGTIRGLWSGALFSLTNHPRDAENAEFCVLRCEYKLWGPEYRSDSDREGVTFEISLVAQPSSLPYSPPRTAPIPVSPGPQTATVVGPGGEEIFTDEYSRVKVQFHWDRIGGNDENSSCFVRVSSAWAGTNWGFIQIPRIGQEVIVDFLDGDPDKPIITGRVYNAANRPPYELPGNATQSGWKSNSSPGGGGFNELRFEDKAGSEEVYFQAQKDHTELIKNDENRTVQNNMSERVDVDSSQSIGNNRTEDVVDLSFPT